VQNTNNGAELGVAVGQQVRFCVIKLMRGTGRYRTCIDVGADG